MKKLKIILLFTLVTSFTFGQDKVSTEALSQAKEMISFYNNREIEKYVDYLLPVYYGNNASFKEKFSEMWKKILKQDTANFKLQELSKLTKSENQYQALFNGNFRNSESYIIGISDDNGKTWSFTQFIDKNIKFEELLEAIPTLDHALAKNIDTKFGQRVNYKVGETISPFNFTDIDSNVISSKSLKGKAIVLNFWGIWCAPCVKEIPELNKLVKKYSNEDIKFIAPAISSPKETLKNHFLPKNPFSYNIVLINGDDYVISSYPTHVIINQKHEVIDIITGYSEENLKKLEKAIDKAI